MFSEFEFINLANGETIAYASSPQEVVTLAEDYRSNPDVLVVGIDDHGRQANSWPLDHVLCGYFERDIGPS